MIDPASLRGQIDAALFWIDRILSNVLPLQPVLVAEGPAHLPVPTPRRPILLLQEQDGEAEGAPMGAALKQAEASDDDDLRLVDLVLRGDQRSYRVLVERYQSRIYAVAFGVLRNREDAREATQESFVKAYRNLPTFRRDSSFYTWLYRIAFNLALDSRRKVYRSKEIALIEEEHDVPDGALDTGPAPIGNPDRFFQNQEIRTRVKQAIDTLPAEQRTAIVLREVEGLSYKEIADTMGCAEGTVMSRLFYARKKLQELLRELR